MLGKYRLSTHAWPLLVSSSIAPDLLSAIGKPGDAAHFHFLTAFDVLVFTFQELDPDKAPLSTRKAHF